MEESERLAWLGALHGKNPKVSVGLRIDLRIYNEPAVAAPLCRRFVEVVGDQRSFLPSRTFFRNKFKGPSRSEQKTT
jgi:hypothetical protein